MVRATEDRASTESTLASRRSSLTLRNTLVAACGAIGLNLLIFAVAKLGGVDFAVPAFGDGTDSMTVNAAHVVLSTLIGLVTGWAVALVAGRIGGPSLRAVAMIGGSVAVISCVAPLTLDASGGTRASLTLMHLAAGAVFVAVLLNVGRHER